MDIIGRSHWGARHRPGFGARRLPTQKAILHHSVTLAPDLAFTDLNADSLDDDEVRAMRAIEDVGQSRFGGGFSYNVAFMPSGRIYEGCGITRVGSHTGGQNTITMGLVLVGNYSAADMTTPMINSVALFLREGHKRNWIDLPRLDGGHRDVKQTECPGNFAYGRIPLINALAEGKTELSQPPPVQGPPPPAALKAPGFPLPRGSYFGPEGGPRTSVSGYHSHREDLRRWQQRMHDRGWNIIVDGYYGPRGARTPQGNCADVARAFQREKGLSVDALIGPQTWRAAWEAPVT